MSNLQASFEVVFPLLVLMALGYGMRCVKLWEEPIITKVNKLVFQLFLPVNIFLNILNSDLSAISSYPMAVQQGGDGELAGQIVVFTSALSMGTLFLLIWLLKSMAWI